jgi:hypothetical protein
MVCISIWMIASWRAVGFRRELVREEQRIRAAGEPLDGAELNAWYRRIPEGESDLTPKYLAMLASLPDQDQKPDSKGIPHFDLNDAPLPGEPWPDIDRSEAFLAHYEETFSLLAEATSQQGVVRYPLDFREGINLKLDHAQQLRLLAGLCRLRAESLCHRGDYAAAAESLIELIRAAETLRDEPVIVTQFLRIAIHSVTASSVVYLVSDPQFPPEQLQRLQTELSKVDRESAAYTGTLGERAGSLYQIITSTPQALRRKETMDYTLSGSRRFRESRPGDCALMLQLATDAVESCRGEYPAVWQQQKAYSQSIETTLRREGVVFWPWERKTLSLLLLPAYSVTFASAARGVAEHRCAIVLLACERHRRQRGSYPKKLADLVPDYLGAVPDDPFTGEPLRLRRDERLTIYSVGQDEKDDGGNVDFSRGLPPDAGLAVPPHRQAVEKGEEELVPE